MCMPIPRLARKSINDNHNPSLPRNCSTYQAGMKITNAEISMIFLISLARVAPTNTPS